MATIAALREVRKAISNEKPSTAVSDWVDRLCSERYEEEEMDGIPELVESINLQSTGPTEAARAIRKKFKYGNVHGQMRAWFILNALVDNCSYEFKANFANEELTRRMKIMASDPLTDKRVKKKQLTVLYGWSQEFKGDSHMSHVASLFAACGGASATRAVAKTTNVNADNDAYAAQQKKYEEEAARRREAKEKAKADKEKAKAEKKQKTKGIHPKGIQRRPFDIVKEKPMIMESVAIATQCSQNLINALQLVNREKESVMENESVQDKLNKAKLARRSIVRYIQLLESDPDGEYLGMLINANEQIVQSLQLYEKLARSSHVDSDSDAENRNDEEEDDTERRLEELSLTNQSQKQPTRSLSTSEQELADIFFAGDARPRVGDTSNKSRALVQPIEPSKHGQTTSGLSDEMDFGANLSDFSDYDEEEEDHSSADEEARGNGHKKYDRYLAHDPEVDQGPSRARLLDEEDPFADPADVSTPGINDKSEIAWKRT